MKRIYANGIQNTSVAFFTGIEVEKTPAFGLKTLFVVGLQPHDYILSEACTHDCHHIYLGANMSFDPGDWINGDDAASDAWEEMIKQCINSGKIVTLDFDVRHVEWVLEGGFSEHDNFIPQISVKIPFIRQFNYNATLKIDDKDFETSNPGVWCHGLHELQSRDVFTPWSHYTKDKLI